MELKNKQRWSHHYISSSSTNCSPKEEHDSSWGSSALCWQCTVLKKTLTIMEQKYWHSIDCYSMKMCSLPLNLCWFSLIYIYNFFLRVLCLFSVFCCVTIRPYFYKFIQNLKIVCLLRLCTGSWPLHEVCIRPIIIFMIRCQNNNCFK